MSGAVTIPATSPIVGATRLLVAPVDRTSGTPLVFDPALQGRFAPGSVPEGWFDLGVVAGVERDVETVFTEVWSGAPATVKVRAQAKVSANLRCTFAGWSRLAMALSGGAECMNLLRTGAGAAHAASGGTAEAATPLMPGSTASVLQLPAGAAVAAGDLVAVDDDYAGQTGYVGAGIPGAFVAAADNVANSPDFIRRVSCNVARVQSTAVSGAGVAATLAAPLPAGAPTTMMKLAVVQGFADRVGGSFVSEWSALLVMDGVAGDRVLVHYPRLQAAPAKPEAASELAAGMATGLQRLRLQADWLALPVTDPNDGETVLCYRSYLPAPWRLP